MKLLEEMPYNKLHLIEDCYFFEGYNQRIYLEKKLFIDNESNHYFLKLFLITPTGKYECQGYIYFYLDLKLLDSKFIGVYIKPEYRNKGLAELLVSHWIKLCLDNGIYDLSTNKKQRKPAMLYLLKNYSFEIEDPKKYEYSDYTINICEGIYDKVKCLLFKSDIQRDKFLNSSIMQEGNYYILESFDERYPIIDQVILSTPYFVQDENEAYKRSLKCIEKKNK